MAIIWDESKRASNLATHGLDFQDAAEVLESRYRLDVPVVRHGEPRILALSYSVKFLAVLCAVVAPRGGEETRVISFRHASEEEREVYHDWLENEYDEDE